MNIVTPNYLTAPNFHESDAELRSLRIEYANTTDLADRRRIEKQIETRLTELGPR